MLFESITIVITPAKAASGLSARKAALVSRAPAGDKSAGSEFSA
jgi:hypothetical protein